MTLITDHLTNIQRYVIQARLNHISYRKIEQNRGGTINRKHIEKCIFNGAWGIPYTPHETAGRPS